MIGATCPGCGTIHGSSGVAAVGRFDPAGVHGYRFRAGGPLRASREHAHADLCSARRPPVRRCECGLTDPEAPCLDCIFQDTLFGGAA